VHLDGWELRFGEAKDTIIIFLFDGSAERKFG